MGALRAQNPQYEPTPGKKSDCKPQPRDAPSATAGKYESWDRWPLVIAVVRANKDEKTDHRNWCNYAGPRGADHVYCCEALVCSGQSITAPCWCDCAGALFSHRPSCALVSQILPPHIQCVSGLRPIAAEQLPLGRGNLDDVGMDSEEENPEPASPAYRRETRLRLTCDVRHKNKNEFADKEFHAIALSTTRECSQESRISCHATDRLR